MGAVCLEGVVSAADNAAKFAIDAAKAMTSRKCAVPEHYSLPGIGSVRDVTSAVLDRDAGIWPPSVEAVRADVVEYVVRAPRKAGVEDLRKARRCLDEMIGMLDG